MTTAAETSALEARIGHWYQMAGTYLVGREKVREYARAVQDYHPAHWDVAAAAELGFSDLVAPLTFTSTPGMTCNRRMFEEIVVGYDTYLQTEEVFEQHRPIVAGDELIVDVELTSVRRTAGRDFITAFVLGATKGLEFIQSFPGAEGLIVTDYARAQTRGFFNHVVSS